MANSDRNHTGKTKNNRFDQLSDIPGLIGIRPGNKLLVEAIVYSEYKPINKSVPLDDGVGNELRKWTSNTAVQMKDKMFFGNDPMSGTASLQQFNGSWDPFITYETKSKYISSTNYPLRRKQ